MSTPLFVSPMYTEGPIINSSMVEYFNWFPTEEGGRIKFGCLQGYIGWTGTRDNCELEMKRLTLLLCIPEPERSI